MGICKEDAFESNYVGKKELLAGPIQATIAGTEMRELQVPGSTKKETKGVVSFKEDVKDLILNFTNWTTIEEAYGEDSDQWVGKVIELYHDPDVMMMGVKKGGTRVRIPGNLGPAAALSAAAPPAPSKRLEWVDALTLADEAKMPRELFKAALRNAGIKGNYDPVRHGPIVKTVLAMETEASDETIPF